MSGAAFLRRLENSWQNTIPSSATPKNNTVTTIVDEAPKIGIVAQCYRGGATFAPDMFVITRKGDLPLISGSICEVRDGKGEEVRDPTTQEYLGTYFVFKGHIHITEVYEHFFVCSRSVLAGGLFPEIAVGDEVRYVSHPGIR